MKKVRLVLAAEEAVENIRLYVKEVQKEPRLAARIKQHPAWYAINADGDDWIFGPSKFVGYYGTSAREYVGSYSRKDGKETEPVLRNWFTQVDPKSPLGRTLRSAFVAFAEQFGKTPNANWRVSVLSGTEAPQVIRQRSPEAVFSERIAFDPLICGGRARIAGTRMRVSDIVAMIADGAGREEILADFPYLKDEDISAALAWAARSVDHLVLRAA